MKRALPLLLASALPLSACVSLDGADEGGDILDVVQAPASMSEMPRGSYMVIPPTYAQWEEEQEVTSLPHAGWIFYMNRSGGTYTPGINNAGTNRSTIINQTSTINPWNVSDAGWAEVMSCVRDQFAAYDVEITDVDPGPNVPHIESVVAGSPGNLGLPGNVGGVSPFTSDCSVIQNSIVFTFAEVYGNNYRVICEVVAQEVAHSFGLDHQFLCEDPMTYLSGCGQKSFQNVDAQCGEDAPRTCACGQQTQNSVAMLSARIGVAGDQVAPTLSITSPPNGAVVPPGFTVNVTATDDVAITRVELFIDGNLVDTDTSAPFSFITDAALPVGSHTIETRAYDSKNVTTETITVTVDEQADPIDPNDPNDPNDPIDPNDPNDPTGPAGDRPSDLVGGCSAGGGSNGTTGLLFLLATFLVFAGRRRAH